MPGLRNITVFAIKDDVREPFEVPLAETPANLLTALPDHPDGLPKEFAHRMCDDLIGPVHQVQRAGIQLEWLREGGRAVLTLASTQNVEKADA